MTSQIYYKSYPLIHTYCHGQSNFSQLFNPPLKTTPVTFFPIFLSDYHHPGPQRWRTRVRTARAGGARCWPAMACTAPATSSVPRSWPSSSRPPCATCGTGMPLPPSCGIWGPCTVAPRGWRSHLNLITSHICICVYIYIIIYIYIYTHNTYIHIHTHTHIYIYILHITVYVYIIWYNII